MRPHLSVDFEADSAVIEANRAPTASRGRSSSFGAAKLIISFGADFLEAGGSRSPSSSILPTRARRSRADRGSSTSARAARSPVSTATSGLPCKPGRELAIAAALAGKGSVADAAAQSGVASHRSRVSSRISRRPSPALVLAGASTSNARHSHSPSQRSIKRSGAIGATIRPAEALSAFDGASHFGAVVAAAERMRAGQVPIAFVRGANPAYTLPVPPGSPRRSRRCRSRSASRSIPTKRPTSAT